MHRTWLTRSAASLVAAAAVVLITGAARRAPAELKVCVDPYNMPFSNDKEEGFENKIAHVVARDLNAAVVNFWWPQRRGFLRNVCVALGNVGDRSALSALQWALADPEPLVREHAAWAIEQIQRRL